MAVRLSLLLDPDTAKALERAAVVEHRPPRMQAEVLLRRALGLPAPPPHDEARPEEAERA